MLVALQPLCLGLDGGIRRGWRVLRSEQCWAGLEGCGDAVGWVVRPPQDLSTPVLHEHCTEERVPVPKSSQREGGNKGGDLLGPAVVTSCAGAAGPT